MNIHSTTLAGKPLITTFAVFFLLVLFFFLGGGREGGREEGEVQNLGFLIFKHSSYLNINADFKKQNFYLAHNILLY